HHHRIHSLNGLIRFDSYRAADQPTRKSWSQIASVICERDPARRRDPAEVATILARHYEDGWTPTQISREINRSRSTVSRIISHAAHFAAA
ncbi:helix-turn-helix domain-containing protein, partial [Nocardia sp. JCM 34519]